MVVYVAKNNYSPPKCEIRLFKISEAQIRFLKAKLRVMQEEVDKLGEDCKKKVFSLSYCYHTGIKLHLNKGLIIR